MDFKLYKLLHIDNENIHSIGIFRVSSSDTLNKKYFAMYFNEDMKSSMYDINENDFIDRSSALYFIFSRYVVDNPWDTFEEPEDALFNVFKMLYKNNQNFKQKKMEGRRHGS